MSIMSCIMESMVFILLMFNTLYCHQEPNPSDPLNKEAAQAMKQDFSKFEKVNSSL